VFLKNIHLQHNKVDNALMEALASKVVSFHKKAKKISIPYDPSVSRTTFNDIYVHKDFVLKELGQSFAEIIDQFKCLRANIRAKVHILSAINAHTNKKLVAHLAETRKYLSLMKVYMSNL
jgi:aminoglycoside phosphotransferase family enzyme